MLSRRARGSEPTGSRSLEDRLLHRPGQHPDEGDDAGNNTRAGRDGQGEGTERQGGSVSIVVRVLLNGSPRTIHDEMFQALVKIVLHILLYGSADGVCGHPSNDRFGDTARQDGQADQPEKQVEPFPQHRCIAMAKEDVDAAQDPKSVREAAQRAAKPIDDATLPSQAGKQVEAHARYHADENPRHKANNKAPHISSRGPERVEWGKDKRD